MRLLLHLPLPKLPVPRVLGVDDFALRKRHRYATVLTADLPHVHAFTRGLEHDHDAVRAALSLW